MYEIRKFIPKQYSFIPSKKSLIMRDSITKRFATLQYESIVMFLSIKLNPLSPQAPLKTIINS